MTRTVTIVAGVCIAALVACTKKDEAAPEPAVASASTHVVAGHDAAKAPSASASASEAPLPSMTAYEPPAGAPADLECLTTVDGERIEVHLVWDTNVSKGTFVRGGKKQPITGELWKGTILVYDAKKKSIAILDDNFPKRMFRFPGDAENRAACE